MNRSDVLNKCEDAKYLVAKTRKSDNLNVLINSIISVLENRINEILDICSVEKYNLYFIGEVGVGKTTAICTLFNLIHIERLMNVSKLNDVMLLQTGSGRSTLCDVVLKISDGEPSKIHIQGTPFDEVEKIIEDYVSVVFENKDSSSKNDGVISYELKRVIDNMLNFPKRANQDDIRKFILELGVVDFDNHDEIKKAIIAKIDYHNRTKTYFKKDDFNENIKNSDWLNDIFQKLNMGKVKDAPIPVKIEFIINKVDFDIRIPSFIESVIDTRGIDVGNMRNDLTSICTNTKNLCMICEDVTKFGKIISDNIFNNIFVNRNADLKFRNFIMGIEKIRHELENVNDSEDRDDGKYLKKDEANIILKESCFDKENMVFYNPSLEIDHIIQKNKNAELYESDHISESSGVFEFLENSIENMYTSYYNELNDIIEKLSYLRDRLDITKYYKKISLLYELVEQCLCEINLEYDILYDKLIEKIRSVVHPSFLKASVNRRGEYFNFDIYIEAANISYIVFDKGFDNQLYYLDVELDRIFNCVDDLMDRVIKLTIHYKINDTYKKYRAKNAMDYNFKLKQFLYNHEIWNDIKNYWGGRRINGKPYRDAVADEIYNTLLGSDVIESLRQEENAEQIFKEILLFLSIE